MKIELTNEDIKKLYDKGVFRADDKNLTIELKEFEPIWWDNFYSVEYVFRSDLDILDNIHYLLDELYLIAKDAEDFNGLTEIAQKVDKIHGINERRNNVYSNYFRKDG